MRGTTMSRNDLKTLVEKPERPCISIYMPTHRDEADARQATIRFRNLLKEVEERLMEVGTGPSDIKRILRPAHRLLEDKTFWMHQREGLVVFMSPSSFGHYRIPLRLEEAVIIGDRFHVEPLMPLLSSDGRFLILALSLNHVRLLEATHYSVVEMRLPGDVPQGINEALKYDDFEMQHQLYSGTPGSGHGRSGAIFYGLGVGSDLEKGNIARYFRQVNRGLHTLLREETAPMILAGVEYLLPIYKDVSDYRHITEGVIPGNPDDRSAKELRDYGWKIVHPLFEKARRDALNLYRQLAGTGRTSDNIKEIIPAAFAGRIATLFVENDCHLWGNFDPNTQAVEIHNTPEPGDQDLLDVAAVESLLDHGAVYAMESLHTSEGTTMPSASPAVTMPVAAIFRY